MRLCSEIKVRMLRFPRASKILTLAFIYWNPPLLSHFITTGGKVPANLRRVFLSNSCKCWSFCCLVLLDRNISGLWVRPEPHLGVHLGSHCWPHRHDGRHPNCSRNLSYSLSCQHSLQLARLVVVFVVQSLSRVQCSATPRTTARQAPLSFTVSQSLLRFMSIKLWKILKEMGRPDHLTCLLRNLYAGQEVQLELDMEQQTGSK